MLQLSCSGKSSNILAENLLLVNFSKSSSTFVYTELCSLALYNTVQVLHFLGLRVKGVGKCP